MRRQRAVFFLVLMTTFLFLGCQQQDAEKGAMMEGQGAMGEMEEVPDSLHRMQLAPLVPAYYEGQDAFFVHTEASDSQVTDMLTKMMGPKVVHVPWLSQVADTVLAPIYVFKNGVEGMGPFGYQRDVLTSVPGDDGYTPLRSVHLVTWKKEATPRELQSAAQVIGAAAEGLLSIEKNGAVINAPVLAWPGGHR